MNKQKEVISEYTTRRTLCETPPISVSDGITLLLRGGLSVDFCETPPISVCDGITLLSTKVFYSLNSDASD